MPNLFHELGSSLTDAVQLGSEANIASIERRNLQRIADERARDRATQFGSISRLFNIGGTLFSNFQANRELSEFAEERGFSTVGSGFTRLFGTPKFEKDGEMFDRSFIFGLQELERFRSQKNLLDSVTGGL